MADQADGQGTHVEIRTQRSPVSGVELADFIRSSLVDVSCALQVTEPGYGCEIA